MLPFKRIVQEWVAHKYAFHSTDPTENIEIGEQIASAFNYPCQEKSV